VENDKELFAPSVCGVLCVHVSAGDTAYGGASGHMLFSAVKLQIMKIAIYYPPFHLGVERTLSFLCPYLSFISIS